MTQSHSRRTSSDSSHALSDQPSVSPTSNRSRTSSSTHLRSPSSPQEPDSLPVEWYNSHVKLPLPKPHTPILFFEISRMPLRDLEDDAEGESEEEDTEDLNNEQLRRKRIREEERGKLFLLVATKSIVYLFESGAGDKRSWKLTRELTVSRDSSRNHRLHRLMLEGQRRHRLPPHLVSSNSFDLPNLLDLLPHLH